MEKTIKPLPWLFFILFSFASSAFACDVGDFVYEEFGVRCQNITKMIKKLQTARKMKMPNALKIRADISNEWVSFYLSHGESAPASFTTVLPETWKNTLQFAGHQITDLVFERADPKAADAVCIVFDMLALEKNLVSAHELMSAWKAELERTVGDTDNALTDWLGLNLNAYINLLNALSKDYPSFEIEGRDFINSIKMEWFEVIKAPKHIKDVLFRLTGSKLVNKMVSEYNRFKIITFYK